MRACVLPPLACQSHQCVRSDLSLKKPTFVLRVHFLRTGMPISGVPSGSLLIPDHAVLFLFCSWFFLRFLSLFRFAPFASREMSVCFQAHTQRLSLIDFYNCQAFTVLSAYSSFSHASLRKKITLQLSRLWVVPLFFVTYAYAYASRRLVVLSFSYVASCREC